MDERARRAEELLAQRLRDGGDGDVDRRGEAGQPTSESELQQRIEELTHDLQRVFADFANYRKRNESDRAEFARFAKADLITRLIDVLDDFDRALENVPPQLSAEPWVEGMWLVERKLRDILASEGLEAIESTGKPFDPYVHEALAHVASDRPEGTVVDEVRKAYKLHDRVIRPALVTVAKPSEERAGNKE